MSVFVQGRVSTQIAGPTSSPSFAYSSNTTAGNKLPVSVSWDSLGGATITSVTDTAGDTFHQSPAGIQTNGTRQMAMYYVDSTAGGANTVTFNFSTTVTNVYITLAEYSGLGAGSSTHGEGTGTTTTAAQTSSFTPGVAGRTSVVMGWSASSFTGAGNDTASATPYTIRAGNGTQAAVEDYLSLPGAGATAATMPFFVPFCPCTCSCVPQSWIVMGLVFPQAPAAPRDAVFFNHI